jgi:DNA processing protein
LLPTVTVGISIVRGSEDAMLSALREPPDALWVKGGVLDMGRPRVAIVGARRASGSAMAAARRLGQAVASLGGQVLSGGALGIDTGAHQGALDVGVPTFAVLACGLDRPYPSRNQRLFERMVAGGGGLVSAYPPGVPPLRHHFLERNRLIAEWSHMVCVVEAESRSGALSTARAARQCGRVLVAVPGSPGCDALIDQGAAIIRDHRDMLDAYRGRPTHADVSLPMDGTLEARLLSALVEPLSAEVLANRTELGMRTVARTLAALTLDGLVQSLPDQRFARAGIAHSIFRGIDVG